MTGRVRNLLNRDGRYFARLVVPKELRPYIGKTELRTGLGPDYRTALKMLPGAVATLQHEIALGERRAVAAGEQSITVGRYPLLPPQIASRDYQMRLADDAEIRAHHYQYAGFEVDYEAARLFRDGYSGKLSDDELERLIGERLEEFKSLGNHSATKGGLEWRLIAQALCVSAYEAMSRQHERNDGDFKGEPSHPLLTTAQPVEDDRQPVSLKGLLTDYLDERAADGKGREARKRWTPVFADLSNFIRHNDARKLTKQNLLDWKDASLKTLASKTVGDVYLASVRTVLKWAVNNDRLETNVAENVRIKVSKRQHSREKGFTLDEAVVVLKVASDHQPKHSDNPQTREAPQTTAAKRWSPILCAHTGARIAEITQLRKQDFRYEKGVPVVRIAPNAGSVKAGNYRDVPLHQQLIDLGLMDFVEGAADGPLFYPASEKKDGTLPARTVAGRISEWLQAKKVIPEGVSPSHGWRHRFKTVGLEIGVAGRILEAIQGHAGRTAGDDYGDVTITAKASAIARLPRYEF
ncbi:MULTISPECIES: tyrosine-type recombinase/integrase [unclassified Mesorhizobium]|uniref:tyrosine-type recombinase/integrase n=1 Tax=unclassified Mesorhizobium TaxID=325217 RepID=UPI001128C258|nr:MULTISPECIES: tyrosine-type recombinase/integrase [unclassified Mesorhizobium]TPK53817.1 integrase [Mesorhizobium sp. B2-5-2]TPL17174.1 integrase [Mesorhizobium sp. B2-4-7]TPL33415.1 integrase [Mesorhizobium sp. B2-4-5]TPM69145.1 integrase [Mesorhizobium sp. B2-1-6]TPN73630.1 integrase [Mesorhizobium sp. B1-1-2]